MAIKQESVVIDMINELLQERMKREREFKAAQEKVRESLVKAATVRS